MKKLIFIRHGRAEEPAPELTDFDRSLTTKGKLIAKVMARELGEEEKSPGTIVTSPAFRALETALIFAGEFGVDDKKIIIKSNLYYKMSYQYLYEILSLIHDDTVTLFGHNPSFTEISDSLSKSGCGFMPKCGIAGISFNIKSWHDLQLHTGKLEYFLKPEKSL